jgi:hypothetical protein
MILRNYSRICSYFLRNIPNSVTASRWLHPDDPLRRGYSPGGPPAPRTHAQACAEAKASDRAPYHTWDRKSHPRRGTGINHWSPLSVLNKFDMIWDFCPDMMHIIKTFFERLVLGVFSGARKPTKFKRTEPVDPGRRGDRQEFMSKKRKYEARKVEYEKARVAFDECIFDADARKIVDERVKNLVGYPNWIKASLVTREHCTTIVH